MALTQLKTGAIADDAVTTDKLANAINTERTANTAKDLTALSASNLTSGTVPDARFPATLPAASAANLTAVPAANITGTLPAISGANLTSLTATNLTGTIADARFPATLPAASAPNLTPLPAANITGTLPAISGANLTGISSAGKAHNLVINGAMLVAQRGTSSTTEGYTTVDRFNTEQGGVDEGPTREQADVAAGTTPYTLGFRKCFKITNGNQTGGAGSGDRLLLSTKLEAQDIANSGWNYLSTSSYITLSFWVKSSVAQNFYFRVQAFDGGDYSYVMETGSLSADTWTKITKTIPGNSNLQFDNDNGEGFLIRWALFRGTDQTGTRPLNAWASYDGSTRYPDMTSTWYTTNDATFELTGVQLEVGESATDFEHRSYAQELALCQRYYYAPFPQNSNGKAVCVNGAYSTSQSFAVEYFPVVMRAAPTGDIVTGTNYLTLYCPADTGGRGVSSVTVGEQTTHSARLYFTTYDSAVGQAEKGSGYIMVGHNSFKLCYSAEL